MKEDKRRFREECERAIEESRKTLKKILADNCLTEYGRKYGFSKITDPEDYRKLPITEYEDYGEDIERMMQGEEMVLTAYPVKYFLASSGSSRQKYFPITYPGITRGFDTIYCVALPNDEEWESRRHLHTSVLKIDSEDRITILSCAELQTRRERTPEFFDKFIGGEDFIFSKEIGDQWYVKLWLALTEPGLRSIYSIYLYDILLLFQYFREHWEEILRDMEQGIIPDKIDVSRNIRQKLLSMPMPDKEWLDRVRQECRKGFSGIGKRVWKDLVMVNGIGGKVFGTQEQVLREYLGDVAVHFYIYCSSEAHIGIALEEETDCYAYIPHSCFVEFLPYDEEDENREIKWIGELEEGEKYELVITNFSGLYRYRLYDVVEVVGFYGQSPLLRFAFRRNMAVNIAGEKTNLSMIADIVKEMSLRMGEKISEYSVCVDESVMPNRYCFFLEGENEGSREDYESFLEDALCRRNSDYKDLKELREIAKPVCLRVEDGTHALWKEEKGVGGHNKPLQFSADPQFIHFMKEREKHGAKK
ncbi:MAG: GH3 auxin-responsive promoter family protein [Lachnospiraceae bacterium]|nr:GH3 auxin-responsive promoter family protein [Lachnospiraceae bacterium]